MIVSKALLFDLDGTLVDTTAAVEQLWLHWANKHGLDKEAILSEIHGTPGEYIVKKFAPHLDLEAELDLLFAHEEKLVEHVIAIPGAKEMLEQLGDMPWGIVTMSTKSSALKKLKIAGLPIPHVLVSADDVLQGKPHPAPYLKAAQWLDICPEQCLVFEDAKAGITSGINAGMSVIQIMHAAHSPVFADSHHHFQDWCGVQIEQQKETIFINKQLR
ncbi:HAD-IA family hydrolase [Psychromonas sp. Urea-02u-13]|uniref:HAD-IA family hydrolase n=1 Tax=Psychromonas sp. Urea-02u-13 TaxID=2058326 RepID=UPI0012FF52FD|nr:HAD-IA family hydrolase [Psychromonas sp. Urea-02u-13]